jgi:hypothetical protein
MSNVRFLYAFKFDDATITSSSEESSLPDDNVVDDFVAKVWRATGDTSEWIKFDLGSAMKITMCAIFGHNLTNAATVKLQGNASDAWGAPIYDTAFTYDELALVLFLDQTLRWWRITVADAANPDGYIELGRVCAGEYIEPSVNVHQDVTKRFVDPSYKQYSEGRQGYAVEKDVYRVFEVMFDDIDRTQQDQLETMFRSVKTIRPLVVALDPDNYSRDDTIYCEMTTGLDMALGALAYGDVSVSFEEKIG